ncbi:MAG: DUF4384 domain-containing protein [Candidatus Hatepunaea meridiana]|nr:DUF4384 domain-containing protein [Candidatus Hatepunaea meridiana]
MIIYITLLILSLSILTPAYAQEWFEGTGVIRRTNISIEEARNLAFEKARVDALAKARLEVTGVKAREQKDCGGSETFDNFIQFTVTKTKGLFLEIVTVVDTCEMLPIPGGGQMIKYTAVIKARIETKVTEPDPNFTIDMTLNLETFRNGEEMVIKLLSSKDCYVTIFNMYSNDSLSVLFPNALMSDNFLQKGDTLSIPPLGAYWGMPVGLSSGKKSDNEALLAVVMKKDIPFRVSDAVIREGVLAQSDALLAVHRWLADIDADQRAEAWCFYKVVE